MPLKKVFVSISLFLKRSFRKLIPPKDSLKWTSYLIFIFAFFVAVITFVPLYHAIGFFYTLIMFLILFILALLTGLLLDLVIALLNKIPGFFRTTLAAFLLISFFLFAINTQTALFTFLYLTVALSLTGISLYQINESLQPRKINFLMLFIGIAALALWTIWLINPGERVERPLIASLRTDYRPGLINIPDPSRRGPYPVAYLTYGSGEDLHRREYGKDAVLLTETVDGSKLLPGWKGFSGDMRTRYFGFDAAELPLNGRVWFPDGVGPFPLILIVHGNHLAQEYSDPGYAYLGEHWASRGMITVSVDQNFLNGSFFEYFGGGLGEENDARGWLLLEHLKQWQHWEQTPDNPFYRRVDLDNVALAGHSRGGEAVAHAALFNNLPHYPDDARLLFDFNFGIVSLIAIAPSDGQYMPSVVRTPLHDINYLTLQGSHDADVTSFSGQRQFERVTFSEDFDGFAATVYIHGANHGQFNTVWGRKDFSAPQINYYNLYQLMDGEEQRQAGKVFMTAFLERTLMFAPEFEALFLDYRAAPPGWLPETIYLQQYKRAGMLPVCNYEEDLDLTTTTVQGGTISSNELTDWYERRIRLKHYSMDSKALYLGWNRLEESPAGSYRIVLPGDFNSTETLYLNIADSGRSPSHRERENEDDKEESPQPGIESDVDDELAIEQEVIDFTIRLSDRAGREKIFPLSSFSPLQPMIKARLGKLGFIHPTPYGEPVLQLFTFDLATLGDMNPEFDPQNVREIELIFNITESGVIVIDEIGFM